MSLAPTAGVDRFVSCHDLFLNTGTGAIAINAALEVETRTPGVPGNGL
jgi:hypothetical protein